MRVRGGGCPSWFRELACLAPNRGRFPIVTSRTQISFFLLLFGMILIPTIGLSMPYPNCNLKPKVFLPNPNPKARLAPNPKPDPKFGECPNHSTKKRSASRTVCPGFDSPILFFCAFGYYGGLKYSNEMQRF